MNRKNGDKSMNKKIKQFVLVLGVAATLAGCSGQTESPSNTSSTVAPSTTFKTISKTDPKTTSQSDSKTGSNATSQAVKTDFISISAEEAKKLMDSEKDYILLDVRTQAEYDEGYIPGSVLLPHDQIADKAAELLKNKDQLILVYCRSGNRSKVASQALSELGYTQVREMGGIKDWPYEIEK